MKEILSMIGLGIFPALIILGISMMAAYLCKSFEYFITH